LASLGISRNIKEITVSAVRRQAALPRDFGLESAKNGEYSRKLMSPDANLFEHADRNKNITT
jgi:hypothetical protein